MTGSTTAAPFAVPWSIELYPDFPVIKYGYSIGIALEDITVGQQMHTRTAVATCLKENLKYNYPKKGKPLKILRGSRRNKNKGENQHANLHPAYI
jgi:hypothetical protein